jgi:uncharacterized protein GlcG (DUF336 family)
MFTKKSVSHETAQKMVAAAVAKARRLGVPQVVAVLDESGLLKAFCRMDGAGLVNIEVAQNKAYTALFGVPSEALYASIKDDPALLSGVPHIPRISMVAGGLPIDVRGHLLGGIGVSGGTAEEDVACARAGLDASGFTKRRRAPKTRAR